MAWPENVRKADLRVEYFRGSGKGGQKRNKTSSACRITHIPTGRTASSEATRSQTNNRADAFTKLALDERERFLVVNADSDLDSVVDAVVAVLGA